MLGNKSLSFMSGLYDKEACIFMSQEHKRQFKTSLVIVNLFYTTILKTTKTFIGGDGILFAPLWLWAQFKFQGNSMAAIISPEQMFSYFQY